MDSSSQPADSVGVRRRWYQFSLRSLLLQTVMLATVGSWLAVRMRQAQRNREVSAEVQALAYELRTQQIQVHVVRPERGWLDVLLDDPGDEYIAWVRANNRWGGTTAFDDVSLGRLKGHKRIEELELLNQSRITGAGLVHLEGLTSLRSLVFGAAPRSPMPGWYT